VKIEWNPLARFDLLELAAYIAEDNADAAYRLLDEIESQAELLRNMPQMGRPGRRRGTRELVIAGTAYVLAYRVERNRIEVLRVLHGARRWRL
jgi:toxin ParE1/3/4